MPRRASSSPVEGEAARAKEAADMARRAAGERDEKLTAWADKLLKERDAFQSRQRKRDQVIFTK